MSAGAVMTDTTDWGAETASVYFSHFWSLKFQDQGADGSASVEGPLPGLQTAVFSEGGDQRERTKAHIPSCAVLGRLVVSDSLQPHGLQPSRLLCPWGFSRQEYWSGLPCPPPGDLPNPEIEPRSPALQVDSVPSEPPWKLVFLDKDKPIHGLNA